MNILLIGTRGCGKTTLGKIVAESLRRRFVDLDDVALAGFPEKTVSAVWAARGEQAWRNAEVAALEIVTREDNQVIALGGGTSMIPQARRCIDIQRSALRARCIYLHCEVSELSRRLTAAKGDRPSLTGKSPADEVAEVLLDREETYREIADAVLDVTNLSPEQAADALRTIIASG